jgi:phosphatidylinositol glycan class P protein
MSSSSSRAKFAFVAYISSIVAFIIYVFWAFFPKNFLYEIGITYYPSRYYGVALPAYMIVLLLLVTMTYIGINLYSTHDPESMATIRDEHTRTAPSVFLKCSMMGGIPDMGDIDQVDMSSMMFGVQKKQPQMIMMKRW